MKTLLAFLVPLLWAVPFLVGLVTQIKGRLPKAAPSLTIYMVAMLVGVGFAEVINYLAIVDGGNPALQPIVLIAGLLLGGTASGAFDIVKLLSAIGTTNNTTVYATAAEPETVVDRALRTSRKSRPTPPPTR